MLDIHLAILHLISMRATSVCKDLMFCIQWVTILLVFQPNNMRFKRVNILQLRQKKTSLVTAINWIKLVSLTIGIARYALRLLNITNGRNGFLNNYSIATTITQATKQNEFLNWLKRLKQMETPR